MFTALLMSRMNTFAALSSSATAVPMTMAIRSEATAAAMPTGSGVQPDEQAERRQDHQLGGDAVSCAGKKRRSESFGTSG